MLRRRTTRETSLHACRHAYHFIHNLPHCWGKSLQVQLLKRLQKSIATLETCGDWGNKDGAENRKTFQRDSTLELETKRVWAQARAPQKQLFDLKVTNPKISMRKNGQLLLIEAEIERLDDIDWPMSSFSSLIPYAKNVLEQAHRHVQSRIPYLYKENMCSRDLSQRSIHASF